jgi:immune inhibitor A
MPAWAERFKYQDGLLVWYCDTSQTDNDTALHPGRGIALPVDAHAAPIMRDRKTPWRNRIQSYDATFGLEATDAMTLHYSGKSYTVPSLPATPLFDDLLDYYDERIPLNSVDHPHSGTKIEVLGTATAPDGGSYMAVKVTAAKTALEVQLHPPGRQRPEPRDLQMTFGEAPGSVRGLRVSSPRPRSTRGSVYKCFRC